MSSQVLELKEKLALISVDPRRELPYFERALSGLMQQRHHECEPHSLSCSIENIGSSFRDMLESGTVVTGSCQNVYPSPGGAQLNIGLMGPLSDPKIRMLQVVDFETEEVMGRAFLRILWNQTTGRPILHLDRIYANGSAEAVSDLIHNEAQQIASGMNLDLLTAKVTQGEETKDEILSFGTVAGCEYSDAMHGLTNGVYKIPLAYLTK